MTGVVSVRWISFILTLFVLFSPSVRQPDIDSPVMPSTGQSYTFGSYHPDPVSLCFEKRLA